MPQNKAIFLDRDGVINKVIMRNGVKSCPWEFKELIIFAEVKNCLEELKKNGFLNLIFTNQPDVRRGFLKIEELEKMHQYLFKKLPVDKIKFCPHDNSDNCSCRKPKAGMILGLAKELNIDLENSFVIGDGSKDIKAGKQAGCKTFMIRKSYNKKDLECGFDFLVKNLKEAVKIIKKLNDK